jgi:hypothetical protein
MVAMWPTTTHLSLADVTGNILWNKDYNFGNGFDDYVSSLTLTPDNGFIFFCLRKPTHLLHIA